MYTLRAVFVCLAALRLGAADPLQDTMAKLDQTAITFKGLTADMKWISHNNVLNLNEERTGVLTMKRPNSRDVRAVFDIRTPDPEKVAFNGKKAERYLPKLNLIEEYEVDKKAGSLVNRYMLLGFGGASKELKQAYSVVYGGAEEIFDQKATRLVLTPKEPDTGIGLTKAELWVSNETGLAVQQKLHLRGGDYNLAIYTNVKVNPNISDSAMSLNAPKNAKRERPLR